MKMTKSFGQIIAETSNTITVDIDGMHIEAYRKVTGADLQPGDLYIAKRSVGWRLLKCGRVLRDPGTYWVESDPAMYGYSYNLYECRKVKSIDGVPSEEIDYV